MNNKIAILVLLVFASAAGGLVYVQFKSLPIVEQPAADSQDRSLAGEQDNSQSASLSPAQSGQPDAEQSNPGDQASGQNEKPVDDSQSNAGMANPASVYCVGQGGKVEIETDAAGGQAGICVMPDGSRCDEWEFFRIKKCELKSSDTGGDQPVCGRENCHGLDIKCGSNVPDACTTLYQLGDKCLKYANCGIVNGACQQIKNAAFDACKACAQKCVADFANDPQKSFDCESKCE